ncbi:hypothetical protein DWG18_05110 [Lysobacter sp. TY2-98]|nr:hypothetical protein DWG18_05110 [Lysobacter sp. TY2-98]
MAQGSRGNADAAIALVATIVLQIALGFAVLQLRPQVTVAVDDDAIRIEFLARPKHRVAPEDAVIARAPGASAGSKVTRLMDRVAVGIAPRAEMAAPVPEPHALDLHVQDPASAPRFEPREVFARRPALDARVTRFERAWAPPGTVLEQARFRSKALGAALGLFGGPARHCTEVERRLRKPDCLALQGDALEDELARNEAIAK